ncbi:p-loop containing nucleoside triphosphate hydrolase like protein [Babesia gibsoni]|uniref:P-loop containing nucleoside triphosphate hydrolase like protein n=1 Tax=Babesia gibsoni TaxID=33632 RepID=A0AAD8LID2_BABGI|nr:p-loop containing nucleoside triphosphate hydrolase like protein [Babesia gibsoni]
MGDCSSEHDAEVKRSKLVVILGPTATGKTDASIQVALKLKEHNIDAEIINADSMQVYKGFHIGTAKPTLQQMNQVKHHLFDFIDPSEEYNAASYVNDCSKTIEKLHSHGSLPILVGGTNMYVEGLLWPSVIDMQPNDPDEPKETYEGSNAAPLFHYAAEYTTKQLYKMLKAQDPERATVLHPNDRKRITRSLNIIKTHGKKHSELIETRREFRKKIGSKYDALIFTMQCDPGAHKGLIKRRTRKMFEQGIIDECLQLMRMIERGEAAGLSKGICQSIAYKEIIPILGESLEKESSPSSNTINRCVAALETATWKYVRRQNTWIQNRLKDESGVKVVHLDTTDFGFRDAKEFLYKAATRACLTALLIHCKVIIDIVVY